MIDDALTGPPNAEIDVGGRRYAYFGGTSYLGLHARPETIAAGVRALTRYGLCTATSRSGFGVAPCLVELETEAARFFAVERAFCVASGFAAPGIALAGLGAEGACDAVFVDAAAHWALDDGARRCAGAVHRFAHADPDDLRRALAGHLGGGGRAVVATDGVFALTGEVAPLRALAAVAAEFPGTTLLVDDAHGVGVLGQHGRGTVEFLGPFEGVAVRSVATLGKALGGHGGVVFGTAASVDTAAHASHWLAGASPPVHPAAAAGAEALRIAAREPQLRAALAARGLELRAGLRRLGLEVADAPTPVVALELPPERGLAVHRALREQALIVPWFDRYAGSSAGVLRITVMATHTREHVARLLDALGAIL